MPSIIGYQDDQNMRLTLTARTQTVSAGTQRLPERDIEWDYTFAAGFASMFDVALQPSTLYPDYTLTNHAPDVAGLVGNSAEYRGPGLASVSATYRGGTVTREWEVDGPAVIKTWVRWIPGSLAAHVHDACAAMIDGRTPSNPAQLVYNSISGGIDALVATRNAGHIAAAYDLSAISACIGNQTNSQYPGVLVTPQHVWCCHVTRAVGDKVAFVQADGTQHIRTIAAATGVGNSWQLCRLDSPITAITPMRLLPTGWEACMRPGMLWSDNVQLPALNIAHAGGAATLRILQIQSRTNYANGFLVGAFGYGQFRPWSSAVVGGDSNGPLMLPINGQLVLVGTQVLASLSGWPDAYGIEAALQTVGPAGYSISRADLSAFVRYYP